MTALATRRRRFGDCARPAPSQGLYSHARKGAAALKASLSPLFRRLGSFSKEDCVWKVSLSLHRTPRRGSRLPPQTLGLRTIVIPPPKDTSPKDTSAERYLRFTSLRKIPLPDLHSRAGKKTPAFFRVCNSRFESPTAFERHKAHEPALSNLEESLESLSNLSRSRLLSKEGHTIWRVRACLRKA